MLNPAVCFEWIHFYSKNPMRITTIFPKEFNERERLKNALAISWKIGEHCIEFGDEPFSSVEINIRRIGAFSPSATY